MSHRQLFNPSVPLPACTCECILSAIPQDFQNSSSRQVLSEGLSLFVSPSKRLSPLNVLSFALGLYSDTYSLLTEAFGSPELHWPGRHGHHFCFGPTNAKDHVLGVNRISHTAMGDKDGSLRHSVTQADVMGVEGFICSQRADLSWSVDCPQQGRHAHFRLTSH